MNIGIFFKIKNRLSTLHQFFIYPFFFKFFGSGARILRARRIQGSQYISIGNNVFINNDAWLEAINVFDVEPSLMIKDGTYIGNSAHIVATQSIEIGEKVMLADRVYLADYSHGYTFFDIPIIDQKLERRPRVSIGDGSWLGEGAIVIGASIGKNCVIGANSVVTSDIPDYSIAVGAPARIVKFYSFDDSAWVTNK